MTKNQFYKAALKLEIGHDYPAGFGQCKLSKWWMVKNPSSQSNYLFTKL